MCIAILNTAGTLPLKTFKQCWKSNPDGAGFCYYDGKKINIHKEMKSYKILHEKYSEIRAKFPTIDIAIHFRIATHGRINMTNCHPFKINERAGFIHNGMINGLESSADFSDTYLFNETILKKLPANFINNTAILTLLGEFIGYSKLVIISGGNSVIVNEELGHWNGENWYSNSSYQQPKQPAAAAKTTGGNTAGKASTAAGWDSWNGYGWGSNEVDFDYKSKTYSAPSVKNSCDCCLESNSSKYYNDWGLFMCNKCLKYYERDLSGLK